jgi:putative ABC transport system permease protein
MSLSNSIHTALRGLSSNKLRAFLTMLGVIIGVASVIAMLAIGNGARAAVEASFRFLGSDNVQIAAKKAMDDGTLVDAGRPLTYEDGLLMPGSLELVNRVDLSVSGPAKIRREGTVVDMNVVGTTASALEAVIAEAQVQPAGWVEGQPLTAESFLAEGRFFTEDEVLAGLNVCVLGHDTALDLFKGDHPIDGTVWVNRQRCTVIGVLVELETKDPEQRYSFEPNEALYLPISTAIQNLYEDEPSVMILAHVSDESRMEEAKGQIAAYLRERHAIEVGENGEYEDDFTLTTKSDILGAQQSAVQTFALLLAAMASISLIVGGIGIMNVMLVSVTERTREIGVRLAVGARGRDIVAQFLLEAVLLSAGGGLLGVALGILSIPLASRFAQGLALLTPASIPLSFGVALLTGLIFGLYPAARAARLDPIEALRYE